MIYENNTCPVCAQTFTAEDDVVFCPDCGTPHHRDCWKAQGGCANAERHAEGFVWAPEQISEPESAGQETHSDSVQCPRCGMQCDANALVCPRCGNRLGVIPEGGFRYNDEVFLRGVQASPDEDLDGITVREAAMFTQYRSPKYVKKFQKLKGDKKVSWNWAALLFSPFWFFYRKIYKPGLFFLGLYLILFVFTSVPMSKISDSYFTEVQKYVKIEESTTQEELLKEIQQLDADALSKINAALLHCGKSLAPYVLLQFLPNIFAALSADYLYKRKMKRDIQSMREFSQNEQTFKMLTLRRGGVSIAGLFGCFLLIQLFTNGILLYL